MRKRMGWIHKRKYQYRAAVRKPRFAALIDAVIDAELKKLNETVSREECEHDKQRQTEIIR
jgi:hypothetical protein